MRKLIFCFSFVCMGLLSSCVDKNELVDEESVPGWLGSSIYGELKNPDASKGLTGSFNTYLRLVDDLGYAETLSRTGSKTVFPANDEAFARFFANETWPGVKRYEDLSDAQKKMLLYSSMLDNALLIGMLSNTSSSDGVVQGRALKHLTSASVIDTVTYYPAMSAMSAYGENNTNWSRFNAGVSVVTDATRPMLVHFTREYMLNNGITTAGEDNDFSIITGGNYEEGDAYIFGNRIPKSAQDITCQNGYIHQVDNVVVPPGNMAQVLKKTSDLSIFSHILDRFAVPVYNSKVTNDYHDWYRAQSEVTDMTGVNNPDSIFEVRYLSRVSQDNLPFDIDANKVQVIAENLLNLDPGWNEFYIAPTQSGQPETYLTDLQVMFVPDNAALINYFIKEEGKSIIETFGRKPNTAENLESNLDDIPTNILAKFVSNMLKSSFAASVPSKFDNIMDDAKDLMGVTKDAIKKKEDGSGYDIKIANNGVIYTTKTVFGPKAYVAVSAPALFSKDMHVINWMIQNVTYNNVYGLNLDFYAYLLTMASNYALFLPRDKAFDAYYLDPASLIKKANGDYVNENALVYHYYYNPSSKSGLGISTFKYDIAKQAIKNPNDSTIIDVDGANNAKNWPICKAHLQDLMQYCTVVLKEGETLGKNNYYKTKHGGAVLVDMNNKTVASGAQIDGLQLVSKIEDEYVQRNGRSYAIDHLIQGPVQSVYGVLKNFESSTDENTKETFFELCEGFDDDVMDWAGISKDKNPTTQIYEVDQYKIFYNPIQRNNKKGCMDNNVKFFSNYNYTVFAPNKAAMDKAYANGLPSWKKDVMPLFHHFTQDDHDCGNDCPGKALTEDEAKIEVRAKIEAISAFARYHFMNVSVFADNEVESGNFVTFYVNNDNISQELNISGGNGKIVITDATGMSKEVSVSDSKLVNMMARDYEFVMENAQKALYSNSSSFAVVHEISEPLGYNKNGNYGWENFKVSNKK